MQIALPAQAAAMARRAVSLNGERRPVARGDARVGPPRLSRLPAPQLPSVASTRGGSGMSGMGTLIDDFECGIAQAEQRVKGIVIGVLVGAALTAFFMARR
jgi:hypothetical protein